jgi:hypothetical protein
MEDGIVVGVHGTFRLRRQAQREADRLNALPGGTEGARLKCRAVRRSEAEPFDWGLRPAPSRSA